MNNTSFLFLIRRDSALQFTAHLAAGIIALLLLTGAALPKQDHEALAPRTEEKAAAKVVATAAVAVR